MVRRDGARAGSRGHAATLAAALLITACGGSDTAQQPAIDFSSVAGKVCTGADSSGWCWQRPLPQGQRMTSLSFPDDLRGWAVGPNGSVLMTADSGMSWRGQPSGTRLYLSDVVFVDAQVGWAAAPTANELLHTIDGGQTWVLSTYGSSDGIDSLGASDQRTAWVITSRSAEGWITRDGGASWSHVATPRADPLVIARDGAELWSVAFISAASLSSALQRSADDGATWTPVGLPPLEAGLTRTRLLAEFIDRSVGLVSFVDFGTSAITQSFVNRFSVWHTTDGGASWQPVAGLPGADTSSTSTVHLADSRTLIGVPGSATALYRSTDGGISWSTVPLPGFPVIASWRAATGLRLLVRDAQLQDWLTTDGGMQWHALALGHPDTSIVNGLWFFDRRSGMAVVSDRILRTADGGAQWTDQASADPNLVPQRSLQFLADGATGYAVNSLRSLLRSSDGGLTWSAQTSP